MRLSGNARTVTGMAEYIEREELMKFPIRRNHYDKEHGNEHFIYGIETVLEYAENLPAADVTQVRHGHWELHGNDDDLAASFFCSLCGWNMDEDEYLDRWSHLNYCPNCGAKMDEVIE